MIAAFKSLNTGLNIDDLTEMDIQEILLENQISQCDVCGQYREFETSDGNGEGTICKHCYNTSDHPIVIAARQFYEG